ncbi:tripartite tricarboxylate transporter permease [Natranaerofaba carboxydovora]|uniref:tripartite tricarboxylate transporter permease n=1 Tax=Natranaerofaba carboxydovora TaxID=2742683 RepID=UPI001F13B0E3|nr:tripartite tricarboxylate transporter permease [Natranaerofaba carboxydovora]UMZ74290.1 Tripartite tricarboxylate transporter TctA family protein [Natranaerofaba carboxydovora]
MEALSLSEILSALAAVLNPESIMWIFVGVVLGIIFGAIPGLTATTAVAVFVPITFGMTVENSMSFLMGIYCGGFYAGSIPAILINAPGAPGNAATIFDGHPMAKQGRAGEALAYSIISSWVGGTVSAFLLLILAPIIGSIALMFAPPEYFAVGLLGMACIAGVSGKTLTKGIAGACIGMFLGTIGLDPIDAMPRFTFGSVALQAGIDLLPALVGLFAISEVFNRIESLDQERGQIVEVAKTKLPKAKEFLKVKFTIIKSIFIGTFVGAIPGTGPTIASWMGYNEAKRSSKEADKFGTGHPEGVIASETTNNSVTGGALIPMLTLGVPGDTVTAVLLGALLIQGLNPGPTLIEENYSLVSQLLWILIIANLFMLIVGLIGSRLFPYVLKTPTHILLPIVTVLSVIGSYGVNNSFFDVQMVLVLGLLGFFCLKFEFPIPPIVLGLILGPIIEPNFRRALTMSDMNPMIFFTRPLSLGILILAVLLTYTIYKRFHAAKSEN